MSIVGTDRCSINVNQDTQEEDIFLTYRNRFLSLKVMMEDTVMFLVLALACYIVAVIGMFTGKDEQTFFNTMIIGTMLFNAHLLMEIKLSLDKSKKDMVKSLADTIIAAKILDIATKNAEDSDSVKVKD